MPDIAEFFIFDAKNKIFLLLEFWAQVVRFTHRLFSEVLKSMGWSRIGMPISEIDFDRFKSIGIGHQKLIFFYSWIFFYRFTDFISILIDFLNFTLHFCKLLADFWNFTIFQFSKIWLEKLIKLFITKSIFRVRF